jgi:hypothetical protein
MDPGEVDPGEVDPDEQARRDKRWEKLQARPTAALVGPFADLMAIFAPAQKNQHLEERKERIVPAPNETEGSGLDVDLDRGTFRIRRRQT